MVRGLRRWHALSSNTITAGGAAKFTGGLYAWLATAYRMSFSREINLGLGNMSSNCSASLCLMRAASNVWCRDFAALEQSASGLDFTGWFIPIAEEHHLIVPLTRYVMEKPSVSGMFSQ